MEQLSQYIKSGRDQGLSDELIKHNLIAGGWNEAMVSAALEGKPSLIVPPPPPPGGPISPGQPAAPIAVVQQLSTRGLEYNIMFLGLGITAVSLGLLLHNYVDKLFTTDSIYEGAGSFAAAALVVALPIFAYLFLRLKRAEKAEPELKKDASRRKTVQAVLVVSFLWGISKIITYVYSLMNAGTTDTFGGGQTSPIGNIFHLLITLGIAGGIFVYYWIDEHHSS